MRDIEPLFIAVDRPTEDTVHIIPAQPWPSIDARRHRISVKQMTDMIDDGKVFFTATKENGRWVKGAQLGHPVTTVGDSTERNNWNALRRRSAAVDALAALMGLPPFKTI